MKKKLLSVIEIGLPVLLAVLLCAIRISTHPGDMKPPTHWEAFTVDDLSKVERFRDQDGRQVLWYAPNNTVVNRLMASVAGRLNTENSRSVSDMCVCVCVWCHTHTQII